MDPLLPPKHTTSVTTGVAAVIAGGLINNKLPKEAVQPFASVTVTL